MKSIDSKTWPLRQQIKMLENGTMQYNNIYQRAYSWGHFEECNLAASLIEGYPIPPVTTSRHLVMINGKKVNIYDLLNGKQRLTAVRLIFENKVRFSDIRRLVLNSEDPLAPFSAAEEELLHYEVIDGAGTIDINGLYFEELPKSLQELMLSRMLKVEYYDNLTIEEERRLIINANAGKGMTPTERRRVEMLSFPQVLRLAKHPIFAEALTAKAIEGYWNEKLVSQVYAMLYMKDVTFESKAYTPFTVKAFITPEQEEILVAILDRILTVFEIAKESNPKGAKARILGKTHMGSIAPLIKRSLEENISVEKMADWLMYFFSGKKRASINEGYNSGAATATASKQSIRNRISELTKSYEEYIIEGKKIPSTEYWTAKPTSRSGKKDEVVRTVVSKCEDDSKDVMKSDEAEENLESKGQLEVSGGVNLMDGLGLPDTAAQSEERVEESETEGENMTETATESEDEVDSEVKEEFKTEVGTESDIEPGAKAELEAKEEPKNDAEPETKETPGSVSGEVIEILDEVDGEENAEIERVPVMDESCIAGEPILYRTID